MKKSIALLGFLSFFLNVYADYGIYASAVYLKTGTTTQFYNTKKTADPGQNIGTVDFTGSLGTFNRNSGELMLQGGEIKTYKSGGNVCAGRLFYRVYPVGTATAPAYTNVALGFFADCTGAPCAGYTGSFPTAGGGCCNGGDQKWQKADAGIDLTNLAHGDYIFEVYYEADGSPSSTSSCDIVNTDGNNYRVTFSVNDMSLPVVFGNIHAGIKNNQLQVDWVSLKENGCDYYSIMGSEDGVTFSVLGKVASQLNGTSGEQLTYSFVTGERLLNVSFIFIALAGCFIMTLLLPQKKRLLVNASFAMLLGCVALFLSCNKGEPVSSVKGKLYIKIVQVALDKTVQESKIVTVVHQ